MLRSHNQTIVNRLTYQVSDAQLFQIAYNERYDDATIGRWRTVRRGLRSWLRKSVLDPDWPWDQQAERFFQSTLQEQMPLALSELTGLKMAVSTEREALLWQTAASASFFAYVADTYETDAHGNELLPALVQGFKEHRTWDTLLMAVFDLSLDEFERDWNRWLAEWHASTKQIRSY